MFTLRETQANETSVEIIAELALTLSLSKHGKLFFNSLLTFDNRSIDLSFEFDRVGDFLRYRERNRALLNQIFKSLHAETTHIDLAFAVDDLLRQRLTDRRRVFESMA